MSKEILRERYSYYLLRVVATNSLGESNATIRINVANISNPVYASKLVASDATAYDEFGTSVAINNDYIVVGAPQQDTDRKNIGSAYVYKKDTVSRGFIQIAQLQENSKVVNSYFGYRVAINDKYIVVGAYGDNKVYVYENISDSYKLVKTLSGSGNFGYSLALDDELLLVGAPENGTSLNGAVFGYDMANNFSKSIDLSTISLDGESFGYDISIGDEYVVVSALNANQFPKTNVGAVYLFKKENSSLTYVNKIFANDSSSEDNFGNSIDIDDDLILIGAFNKDHNASNAKNSGAAYLVRIIDNITTSTTLPQSKIEPSDLKESYNFGYRVNINTHMVSISTINSSNGAIADVGTVYQYIVTPSFNSTIEYTYDNNVSLFNDIESKMNFGSSLDVSNEYRVIGSPKKDANNSIDSGAVYIQALAPDDRPYWVNYNKEIYYSESLVREIFSSFANTFSWTGDTSISFTRLNITSIAPSPSRFSGVVNANRFGVGTSTYQVSFIRKDISRLNGSLVEASPNLSPNDNFGNSIAVSGNNVIIGSKSYDTNSIQDLGIVYYYTSSPLTLEGNISIADINDTSVSQDTYFGSSVALSGAFALIGASGADMNGSASSGTVYSIEDITSVTPSSVSKIGFENFVKTGDTIKEGDNFGNTISVSGIVSGKHYIAIGASKRDGENGTGNINSGVIYIFEHSVGDPKLTQIDRLSSVDITQEDLLENDEFGFSLDISSDANYLVAGVPYKEINGRSKAGVVYVFRKNSSDDYQQVDRIILSNGKTDDNFGYSVSINDDGSYIAIGSPGSSIGQYQKSGSIFLYKRDASGRYILASKVSSYDRDYGDNLGNSVDFHNNYLAVGAYGKFNKTYRAGAVYLFKIFNDKLYEIYTHKLDQVSQGDEFASNVVLNAASTTNILLYSTSQKYKNRGQMFMFDIDDI